MARRHVISSTSSQWTTSGRNGVYLADMPGDMVTGMWMSLTDNPCLPKCLNLRHGRGGITAREPQRGEDADVDVDPLLFAASEHRSSTKRET